MSLSLTPRSRRNGFISSSDFGSENSLFRNCGYGFAIALSFLLLIFASNSLYSPPLRVSAIVRRSDLHNPNPNRFEISYSPVPAHEIIIPNEKHFPSSLPSTSTSSFKPESVDDDFSSGTGSYESSTEKIISSPPSIPSIPSPFRIPSPTTISLPSISQIPSKAPESKPESESIPLLECSAMPYQKIEFEGAIYAIYITNEKRLPCAASTIVLKAERVDIESSGLTLSESEIQRLDRLRESLALELLTYTNRSSIKPRTVPSEYAAVWHRDRLEAHSCNGRIRADVNPIEVSRGSRLINDCKRFERILPLRKPSTTSSMSSETSTETSEKDVGIPFATAIYLPDSSSEFYHVRLSFLIKGVTAKDYAASKASHLDELKVLSSFYSGLVKMCFVSPLLEIQRVGGLHLWHHCKEKRPTQRDAFEHLPIGYGNNCPPVLHLPLPSAADFEVALLTDGTTSFQKETRLLNWSLPGDLSFIVSPGANWKVVYRVAPEVAAQFPNAQKHAAFLGRVSNSRIAYGVDFPAGMEYNPDVGGYIVSGSIRDSGVYTLEMYVAEFFGDNFGELVVRLPDYFLRGQPEIGSPWDDDLLPGFVINVGPFTDHSLGTCCLHRAIAGTKNAEIIISGSNPSDDVMKTLEASAATAAAEYIKSKDLQNEVRLNDDERRLYTRESNKKLSPNIQSSWRRRAALESMSMRLKHTTKTTSAIDKITAPITGFEEEEWDEEDITSLENEEVENDEDDEENDEINSDAYVRRLAASASASTTGKSSGQQDDVQKFGSYRCTRSDLPGRWIRLDENVPCSPPFCSGDRRKSVSAMDWSGATRHWVFVPFECYYHLYTISEVSCCATENNLKWTLVMGDSPVREIFGNMLNFNGSTERYAKFDAIDAVAGLPPPMRLTFQFWHTSFYSSSDYNRARGGERHRPFSVDRAYLDHFNVLPSEKSGMPFRAPGSEHIAPMRVPAKGAEHLYSGLETDTESTRPDIYIANGALAYETLLNSVDTLRSWTADFVKAVNESNLLDSSSLSNGEKFKAMRRIWVKGPTIFSQPHASGESISISRACLFDALSTTLAKKAGWEVLDADMITRARWEDAWDGLHMLREANGDWKGLTSAMVTEALLNAMFQKPGQNKCGGGC